MRHYELVLYYALGYKPKDAIKKFKVSRSTAYRAYRNFREGLHRLGFSKTKAAQQRFTERVYRTLEKNTPEVIYVPFQCPPTRKKKLNHLGV